MEEQVTLKRAFDLIDRAVRPLGPESVEVMLAGGRILAERISAWVDLPGANCAVVDGYAVRSADLAGAVPGKPARLRLAGSSSFIAPFEGDLPGGGCVQVVAGTSLPEGADAVAASERAKPAGGEIEFETPVPAGAGMRKRAEEFRVGETVAERGLLLTPGWISFLIAAGWAEVLAIMLPRVRVIAAGDELRPPGRVLIAGQVYPSAAAGIVSWCKMIGVSEVRLNVTADDPMDIVEELPEPIEVDLIVTLGGTGGGERDVMIEALEARGVNFLFRGVKARPGHYAAMGMLDRVPVVCLPGGPSAAEMIFQVMARRVVAALKGFSRRGLATLAAVLGDRIEPRPENDHLVRVKLSGRDETVATPLFHRGIHREIAESDGVVLVPAGSAADKGQKVEVWLTR
jgi:molybdopterin molybdotransferase